MSELPKEQELPQTQVKLDKSGNCCVDFHDCVPTAYLSLNRKGVIVEINLAGAALLGVERSKLPQHSFTPFVAAEDRDCWQHNFLQVLASDATLTCELVLQHGDGSRFYAQLFCQRFSMNRNTPVVHIVLTDFTRYKADEAKILRKTQLYNALSQCNQAIVRCTTEAELFEKTCSIAVQVGGMKIAWVGLLDEAGKQLVPVASCGAGVQHLQRLHVSMDNDSPHGRDPAAASIREGQPYWCQDFLNDPITAPSHKKAARYGWRASAALPLRRNGSAVGSLILYSGERNAFDDAMRNLLMEMANDLSYALDIMSREAERKRAEQALRESESHLHVVQRLAKIGSWKWIVATDAMQWTEELCKIKGKDNKLPVPRFAEMSAYYTPESWKRLNEAVIKAINDGTPFELELDLVRADGIIVKTYSRGEVDYDADGKLASLHGMVQDIAEQKRADEKLTHYAHEMNERAKQASCLRDITTLFSKKEWSLEFIFDSCVRCMPGGWLDPLRTCARIMVDGRTYVSPNFKETEWKLAAKIPLVTKGSGVVEVFYLGDQGEEIKKPFLDEEYDLLNAIATQLGQSLESRRAEEELKLQNNKFIGILNAIPDGIYVASRNFDMEYVSPVIERECGKVEGKKCYAYLYDRTEPCPWCKCDEVLKDNTVRWQMHSDKTGKDYDMLDAPFINPDGTVSKFEILHDLIQHNK